jgi:adenylate cyclase
MASATPSPISLTILRRDDMLLVDVAEVGALIPRSETRVEDSFLQELAQEMQLLATFGYGQGSRSSGQTLLTASTPRTVRQDLQRLGSLIFSHLFTEPARTRLRMAAPCALHLRLDEQLLAVPWELAYDGTDFLATKFGVGRQVITSQSVLRRDSARPVEGPVKVLLIADPTESLAQASQEVEQLCTLLADVAGIKVTLLGGKLVRKLPLLAAVQEYDIVHFAGHSFYDPTAPHQSGWRLSEGILTAGELSKVNRPPRLVFSNSCQAGTTAAWHEELGYRYEGQAFGIGSAFLLAGVQNYVGTFWVVHDEESVGFALAFYQNLAMGLTLGGALQAARQATITHHDGQGLTWASYLLYGDPTVALLPAHTEKLYSGLSPTASDSGVQPGQQDVTSTTVDSHERDPVQTEEQGQAPGAAMSRPGMQRKLAAIFSADVAGYSRLMGEDEAATIRTLRAYQDVMAARIQHSRGRIVDAPGDNLMAEFASAVDAVRCALEIQHELHTQNTELPAARRMAFRIGINLGDVVVEGEKLYGDGVNIAARLESLAEPGGLCISGTVYDQVESKVPLTYEYLGEQAVKNIAKPVRVYRVRMEPKAPALHVEAKQAPPEQRGAAGSTPTQRRRLTRVVLMVAGLSALVGGIAWYLVAPSLHTRGEPATSRPLPFKPSIAVLPFVNMSSDSEQEYFSDGMTDTLITDLSKLAGLFVIARNSTFAYKGKAIKLQQVSQELGVRYVVEGSVQKAEARVRINAQLVDTTTGHHLWAERYDRELKDILVLQDEITQKIVSALQVKLTTGEQGRIGRVSTHNLEAYDTYLRRKDYWERATQEANEQARQLFERAIALDPQFALAYTALSSTYLRVWLWGWSVNPPTLDQAVQLAEKARALDDALPEAHMLLGVAYAWKGQPEQGLVEGERAIALDPNCAWCHNALAEVLLLAGRPEEALGPVEKAMRLDPESAAYYSFHLGWAYRLLGRYEEALAAQKRTLSRNPEFLPAHVELARLYNELGREEEARAEEAAARRLSPNILLEVLRGKAAPKKQQAEPEGFFARSSASLKAYGYFVYGSRHFLHLTHEENAQAQQLLEKATELDPQFALAHTLLGFTYAYEWAFQWSQDPQTLERALALARQALAVDDASPLAHQLLGSVYLLNGQHERAVVEAEQVIALDPKDADGYLLLGEAYIFAGRPEDSIGLLEKAIRLKPRLPAPHFATLGLAYYLTGRQEEVLDALQQALSLTPNWLPARLCLAFIYSELGRETEAQAEVAEVLRLSPNFSVEGWRQRLPFKDPAETERFVAALRKGNCTERGV